MQVPIQWCKNENIWILLCNFEWVHFNRYEEKRLNVFKYLLWKVNCFVYGALKLCGAVGNVIRKFMTLSHLNTTVRPILPSRSSVNVNSFEWCHIVRRQSETKHVETVDTDIFVYLSNCTHQGVCHSFCVHNRSVLFVFGLQ